MATFILTDRTVIGEPGATLADMDEATCRAALLIGGGAALSPEAAADFLRDVYASVIASAGCVTLTSTPGHLSATAGEAAA